MGYMHIDNLYKNQDILYFKECYALEKIHGTSAHVSWKPDDAKLGFFAGGERHESFVALFDQFVLTEIFTLLGVKYPVVVYGEAYGGKQQGMRHTYGSALKFIAFDVRIGDHWLAVPEAAALVQTLGLAFVPYAKIPTSLDVIDAERDSPSVQAALNGIIEPRPREGVVLRPLIEVTKNNGERIIAKHKGDAFKETATPRKVVSPDKLQVLVEAEAVATEWVTPMRLSHVLAKFPNVTEQQTGEIIRAMVADVEREAAGEILTSHDVRRAIGKRTSQLLKEFFRAQLRTA